MLNVIIRATAQKDVISRRSIKIDASAADRVVCQIGHSLATAHETSHAAHRVDIGAAGKSVLASKGLARRVSGRYDKKHAIFEQPLHHRSPLRISSKTVVPVGA